MMNTKTGYFIIADITGFTSFVAGSELEHSQLILSQILNHIVNNFTPQFTLAEIEGDAVFLYAPVERFSRSEIILEMIESSYSSFRDTRSTFNRLITCNCRACKMALNLDLKYFVHSGEYVLNDVAGKAKPLGTPVNTIHRLLKNKISQTTGWNAYALFTDAALENMDLSLSDLHSQTETYEHIGDVNTNSLNLEKQYQQFLETRKTYLSYETADYYVEKTFSVTPPVLWEWVNNPIKRSLWLDKSDWQIWERPEGRLGKGATNHCANSNFFEKLLDYHPFDYYTSELNRKKMRLTLTGRFIQDNDGTKFIWLMKLHGSLPRWILRFFCKFMYKKLLKIDSALEKLDKLIKEEVSA